MELKELMLFNFTNFHTTKAQNFSQAMSQSNRDVFGNRPINLDSLSKLLPATVKMKISDTKLVTWKFDYIASIGSITVSLFYNDYSDPLETITQPYLRNNRLIYSKEREKSSPYLYYDINELMNIAKELIVKYYGWEDYNPYGKHSDEYDSYPDSSNENYFNNSKTRESINMSILGNLLTRAYESSKFLVHEIEKKVNKCNVKAHTIQDKDGVIKVNCNSDDDAKKVCNSLREKYNCKVVGRVVTLSGTNESQANELKSINQIMEDIWTELQEQTLNVNYINMSKVKFDKSDKEACEIKIPYSAIDGNIDAVAKKAQELVDRFYKEDKDDKYTINVENDEDNEAVRIGVWR